MFGTGERSSAGSIDDWVVVGLNLVREIINTIPYVLGVGRDYPRVTVLMVIHAALSMAAIVIQIMVRMPE
jgi:hypothetical protein